MATCRKCGVEVQGPVKSWRLRNVTMGLFECPSAGLGSNQVPNSLNPQIRRSRRSRKRGSLRGLGNGIHWLPRSTQYFTHSSTGRNTGLPEGTSRAA
ncbi:MAG: hypothetical protein ACE5Z5_01955 [Candidatus Bathyarchaeia archaeon]